MDMLFEPGTKSANLSLPDIILLDLNMPNIDGYKVLSVMHSDPAFKDIAVYILSSSPYEKDFLKWRELGVTDFFVKPYEFEKLKEIFDQILTTQKKKKQSLES